MRVISRTGTLALFRKMMSQSGQRLTSRNWRMISLSFRKIHLSQTSRRWCMRTGKATIRKTRAALIVGFLMTARKAKTPRQQITAATAALRWTERSSGIMSNVDIVFARKDEEAPEEMVKQLPNCPVCGAKAYLQGNTVDGFWLGWSIGCPRYCLNDGIHGHDLNTPQEEYLAEHGFVTKEQAVAWWKKRVKLNGGGTNGEGH